MPGGPVLQGAKFFGKLRPYAKKAWEPDKWHTSSLSDAKQRLPSGTREVAACWAVRALGCFPNFLIVHFSKWLAIFAFFVVIVLFFFKSQQNFFLSMIICYNFRKTGNKSCTGKNCSLSPCLSYYSLSLWGDGIFKGVLSEKINSAISHKLTQPFLYTGSVARCVISMHFLIGRSSFMNTMTSLNIYAKRKGSE